MMMLMNWNIALLCSVLMLGVVNARIHELKLDDDNREQVTISTYGLLKNGLLQVDIKKLEFNPIFKLESIRNSFAFILEKTNNNGFSSFSANDKKEDYCSMIRQKNYQQTYDKAMNKETTTRQDQSLLFRTNFEQFTRRDVHTYSLIVFHLDLVKRKVDLIRIGKDLKNLRVLPTLSGKFGYGLKSDSRPQKSDRGLKVQKAEALTNSKTNVTEAPKANTEEDNYDPNMLLSDKFDNSALKEFMEYQETKSIDFNITNSTLSFKFELVVKTPAEEGLYILSFFNCFQPSERDLIDKIKAKKTKETQDRVDSDNFFFEYTKSPEIKFGVNLEVAILERNEDSFLSAGELPAPTLYLTWSIIYFLAGISWMYILKASKGEVFKIHYLMMALVFVKSISLTFHAINMHYIAVNGTQEAIWAILYYITYVLRGLLLIISILLVGTGFSVIKHILTENERRLFLIVIPLQTLAIIAYIFLEEKEQGNADYIAWRQLFFALDLFCCGAILFPVIWSIRHLEAAARTDGKMVFNLKKLKIFKHFYIMVIFYIYFTRIVGFLLKQMLPFRYEWFDVLSLEVFTFTFFALTAYKFQPTINNPYLKVDDEDLDMEDIRGLLIETENTVDINEETNAVLDLIEQDYYVSGLGSDDDLNHLQPSGPDSKNPTLSSRKVFTNDE